MKDFEYNPRLNGNVREKKSSILLAQITTIIITLFLVFCITAFAMNRTYFVAEVEGASMFPSINAERKLGKENEIAYYTIKNSPQKSDMIIVDYHYADNNIDAIKRLIATGGDTICYYKGNILLNGQVLKEPYIEKAYNLLKNNPEYLKDSGYISADNWKNKGYTTSKHNFETWCETLLSDMSDEEKDVILKDTTFFKNYKTDYAGSVKYSEALGTYTLTIPQGFVYFLGDNRANSSDCSLFGPLEKEAIVAKVEFIAQNNNFALVILWKEILHYFG